MSTGPNKIKVHKPMRDVSDEVERGDLFIYKSDLNNPDPDILMVAEVAHGPDEGDYTLIRLNDGWDTLCLTYPTIDKLMEDHGAGLVPLLEPITLTPRKR
jgi:hypothetical protein